MQQGAILENTVSTKELRIHDELAAEIEDDLEHEIINSMCRLARHLQRLYQQRNIREFTSSVTDYQFSLPQAENALLEMNIRIKLDDQCQIDITKVEKDAATIQPNSCPSTDQSDKRSLKKRHSDDAVHCRKNHNHPVVPWR